MKRAPAQDLRALDALLASRPPDVAERVRGIVTDVRPCAIPSSVRVGAAPLRGGLVSRLLGKTPPPPSLSPLTSKFGGRPYVEDASEIRDGAFLGQIDFSEVTRALRAEDSPIPDGMPDRGLLAIDVTGGMFEARTRWYPAPEADKCRDASAMPSVGKFEAAIRCSGGWSLQGLDW